MEKTLPPTSFSRRIGSYVSQLWSWFLLATATIVLSVVAVETALSNDGLEIDFNRDIQPILAGHCLHCHGPDAATRKAELRLDDSANAMADRGGYRLIVPGRIDESKLFGRITSDDADEKMPPAGSGQLSAHQVELLRKWIAQGAKWGEHWAFVVPNRPSLPKNGDSEWARNAIDSFVKERLEHEGLMPSPMARPEVLLRRVTLALTGLPPTPSDVKKFLADDSPNAYERAVDRLLSSPLYGEHMGLAWLDAARYADTAGYQADWERFMWPWRDWVIDAFNANMPFDQFTIEQIAGDLLPGATLSQRLATGFNRNHRVNDEGGSLDAEFEVEYVVDRVDTTSTVWLGLTMGCARCHDHKYEPISQKDYYRMFAFFNNVPEKGIDGRKGAAKPFIEIPNPSITAKIDELRQQLDDLQTRQATLDETSESTPPKTSISTVLSSQISELKAAIEKLEPRSVTQVQVMDELPIRRPTYLLVRGQYEHPDKNEVLSPALPRMFSRQTDKATPNRLALAHWLVGSENPLTARVTVNRLWQHHFGIGLVRTSEDFGSRGERPSHPALLDWLATELVRTNWDIKAMHRLIVTSATFQQSSHVSPELIGRDPDNRLLARGPRKRLTGAAIRDQALFVGGLLSSTKGGPAVKPYQPPGLWEELSFGTGKTSIDFYVQDHGESLYRRSLYTFWKRTVAPPSMSIFDGGGREMCRVSYELTNTPMQALTLQNDVTFVEAARNMASRMALEGGSKIDGQINFGWQLALGRSPGSSELAVLRRTWERYAVHFRNDQEAATRLLSFGESPCDPRLNPAELAAMTMVAQTILNLDETIMLE